MSRFSGRHPMLPASRPERAGGVTAGQACQDGMADVVEPDRRYWRTSDETRQMAAVSSDRVTHVSPMSRLVTMARPTGVGRALATYEIPIEGRDEWVAAAKRPA